MFKSHQERLNFTHVQWQPSTLNKGSSVDDVNFRKLLLQEIKSYSDIIYPQTPKTIPSDFGYNYFLSNKFSHPDVFHQMEWERGKKENFMNGTLCRLKETTNENLCTAKRKTNGGRRRCQENDLWLIKKAFVFWKDIKGFS